LEPGGYNWNRRQNVNTNFGLQSLTRIAAGAVAGELPSTQFV